MLCPLNTKIFTNKLIEVEVKLRRLENAHLKKEKKKKKMRIYWPKEILTNGSLTSPMMIWLMTTNEN